MVEVVPLRSDRIPVPELLFKLYFLQGGDGGDIFLLTMGCKKFLTFIFFLLLMFFLCYLLSISPIREPLHFNYAFFFRMPVFADYPPHAL
jgi:hypothetical protein